MHIEDLEFNRVLAKHLINVWMKIVKDRGCKISDFNLNPFEVAMLSAIYYIKAISFDSVKLIAEKMIDTGKSAIQIAVEDNLIKEDGNNKIDVVIEEVLSENQDAIKGLNENKKDKIINFLVGKVIKKIGKQVDAAEIREKITKNI